MCMKNVNKKGLCWQAKIARQRFAHGKALSCGFSRCWGLNFGYDDGQTCRFCNCIRSKFVWIRFRLALRRLRGLCWACIVCGTLSFSQPADISPADNPGAEIRWG